MPLPAVLRRATTDGWLLLICGGAVLAAFLLRAGQRHGVAVDYDDGVYWQTALALAAGHQPYTDVFFAQPPLYAWLLALPLRLGWTEEAARLLTLCWALLLVAAAAMLGRAIADRRAGLLAALVVALLPPVQRYCFQFGADLPAAALVAWTLVAALRGRTHSNGRRWWLVAGALLGTAMAVKLIAVVIVPAVVVVAVGRRQALAWVSAGACAAVTVWLVLLRPAPLQAWRQVVVFHLGATGGPPQPVPDGAIAMLAVWIVPFALLASAGAALTLRRTPTGSRLPVVALLAWATAGVAFTAFHRPIFEHHLLLFVAPGAAVIASGISLLSPDAQRWRASGTAVVAAACVLQAIAVPVSPRQETRAVLACLRALPRDGLLLTDDQELAARAGLRTPPQLADTSRVRINSGYLTADDIISAAQPVTAALFAPPPRQRITDTAVLTWVEQRFPIRHDADGYRLYVSTPQQLAGCTGEQRP